MGVHGLWELLAPVGRRVSVETLAGKKLAIDASIWMIQFMKAMRDERGEMVSNAHILGFFRRICKLLFLRTKPVFVFDGGTPALKRRTVAARRRHRENARAKIRKTAEKLLLNHLKSKRLEELAEEIKRSKSSDKDAAKGKQGASVGDERRGLGEASSSGQSHQGVDRAINQESLDELLAASIVAEEEGKLGANVQVPNRNLDYEVEGEEYDDDEEMIFPVTSDNVDPAVLASLPPSMQLNLLDQMRERLMAENRQKYQKIKKVPAKFSELQIQSYLKTVAFRREINEVQKSAAGRGVGGLQTSRIASEANREYIFSSSFTGDKQNLNLTGVETNRVVNQEKNMTAASDAFKHKLFMSQLKSPSKMSTELATKEIGQDVETYLDDRGRVRVSRVRGLGIRMTRDLQRNLDLMKEYDQVFVKRDLDKIQEPLNNASDFPKSYSQTKGAPSPSIINEECNLCSSASIAGEKTCEDMTTTVKSLPVSASGAAIEISFSEDENESKTMTDSFFMNLVFGNQTSELFSDCISLEKNVNEFESECIWEDGKVGEQSQKLKDGNDKDNQSSFVESKGYEEDEVEWEEDASIVSHSVETEKAVSQGLMEEEADLQEAIRRSLEDITEKHCSSVVPVEANTMRTDKNHNLLISVKHDINIEFPIGRNELQSHLADCVEEGCSCSHKEHPSIYSQNEHLPSFVATGERSGGDITLKGDKNDSLVCSTDVMLPHDARSMDPSRNKHEGMCKIATDLMSSDPNLKKTDGLFIENCPIIDIETTGCKGCKPDTDLSNAHDNSVAFLSTNSLATRPGIFFPGARPSIDFSQKSSIEQTVSSIDGMQELVEDGMDPAEGMSFNGQNSMQEEDYIAVSEANLDDEISLLKQERANLGEEQRKLERNAESVSSEMFAECQELLQMFGLPYIISPMEAEAQCAYMEMSNLVDGIVTDDSDVFLFGARNVYKNIFDDRKYVETYFMKDIENELGLSREKLIHMALLLGSDYTVGVSGIGIVNAIEVVNTFPEEDGLLKFKEWVESPDPTILGLHGSHCGGNLNKKSSNPSDKTADEMENNVECSGSEKNCLSGADDQSSNSTISDAKKEAFMDKHRNVSKNWHFPASFPSDSVISAYISPQIDESSEPFAWGKPDLHLLRKICWEKFGWPNQKADELLVPVLKEYNKHETQLRMEAFYSFNERFAKIRSQRIKKAIKGITGTCSSELTDYGEDNLSFNRKSCVSPCMNEQSRPSNDTYRSTARERKSSKLSRSTTQSKTPNASAEPCKQVSGSDERGQVFNAKTRGGQQSGRGRRKGQGKGKGSEDVNDEFTESSSDDEWRNMIKMHKFTTTTETELEMRRSTRPRKQVSYAENNAEINELGGPIKTVEAASLVHEAVTKVMAFGNDGDNINQEKMVLQDYLYSGGSFCLGENETQDRGQPSPASSMKYSFEQNQGENQWPQDVSRSLVSGGGFCIDESDPGLPALPMSLQGELDDANYHQNGQGSDFGTSEQYDSMKQYEGSDLEDLQVIEKGDSSVEQHQHTLSAMPSLKRKRKKRVIV